MKATILPLLLSLGFAASPLPLEKALAAEPGSRNLLDSATFRLPPLPTTPGEFLAFRDAAAKDVRGGAAAAVVAMILYGRNKELGLACLTLTLDSSLVEKVGDKGAYLGYSPKGDVLYLLRQLEKMPWLGQIYVDGTSAESGYALPTGGSLVMRFNQLNVDKADEVRLYVTCSGGNLPRPVGLRKNDKGIWKTTSLSSLLVGPIKMPVVKANDEL